MNIPVIGSNSQQAIESTSEPTRNTLCERDTNGDTKARIFRGTGGVRSDGFLQGGVVSKNANFTAGDDAHVYKVTTAAATIVVSLPQASTVPGREYIFIKEDNGAGLIQLDPFGAELVNGAATFNGTATQYKQIHAVCDGVGWYAKEL
jgi:hypothetical protein